MAITISPLYPVVDEDVSFTSSTAIGDVQVIAVTSLPSASTRSTGLVLSPADLATDLPTSALVAAEEQVNADTAAFDEPGEYGVTIYDISEVPGIRGTDNSGSERRFVLNSSDTGTVHVGAIVDLPIRTAVDNRGATLRLQINDTTVRDADLVDPTDESARVLALTAAVTAALTALVGQTAATMGNDLIVGTTNLRTQYEAHRVELAGAVHAAADNVNVTDRDDPDSIDGAINVLNQLRTVIPAHMQTTPAAGNWHTNEDWKNVPIAAPADDMASATVALADLRERCYELHRVQVAAPVVHGGVDAANPLTAVTVLDTAITAYLDALRTPSPPVLAGEAEGAQDAAANFGFAIQDS